MSEQETPPTNQEERRCPVCDAVIAENATVCLMCGHVLAELPSAAAPSEAAPEIVESVMQERQTPLVFVMTAVFGIIILFLGTLVWRYRPNEVSVILAPSPTPIPPTITYTPTWTPLPTETQPPTPTPSITPTPAPTETPRPPRSHTVSSGETLFGLAFLYRVSTDSITDANNLPSGAQIQVNQNLLIPWLMSMAKPSLLIPKAVNGMRFWKEIRL